MSSIIWSRVGETYKATVDVCALAGAKMNVSYSNKELGFAGQLTFKAQRGVQRTVGSWQWDGDSALKAAIDGEVTLLTQGQFEFEGYWDEKDGSPWDLYVECPITNAKKAASTTVRQSKKVKKAADYQAALKDSLKRYRYQEDLTAELDGLGARLFDAAEINKIVLWKVNRYVRLSSKAMDALNSAAMLKPTRHRDSKGILLSLLQETGVDLPMASTFLRFRNPKAFQIIDRHAYRAVYGVDYPIYSASRDEKKVAVYFDYLDELFEFAKANLIPFEKLDRALYVFDKELNGLL